MPVIRALHKLAADGDREATATLLSHEALFRLFRLMLGKENAEEAKTAFGAVAIPQAVARFERFRDIASAGRRGR